MSFRLLAVVVAGALAAACTTTETRTVVVPAPADDSCSYYGYARGTDGYRICAEREAAARRRGRMAANYAEARMAAEVPSLRSGSGAATVMASPDATLIAWHAPSAAG